MMTSTRLTGVLLAGAVLLVATPASAQRPAPPDRGYAHVNAGAQASSHDFTQTGAFTLYEETATFENRSKASGGALFDIGGGYRVWRNVYAGVSYSRVGSDADGAVTGSVPHPNFHDRFRSVSGSVAGLNHTEHQVHLQAVWRRPITTQFDIALSVGPTFFSVNQDLVSSLAITETGSGPTVSGVGVTEVSESTVGFNLGADGTYMFTSRFGAGGFLRYSGGSVDLTTEGSNVSVDVGGFQVGVGARVRF